MIETPMTENALIDLPTFETGLPPELEQSLPTEAMLRVRIIGFCAGERILNTMQNLDAFEEAQIKLDAGMRAFARKVKNLEEWEKGEAEGRKLAAEFRRQILR